MITLFIFNKDMDLMDVIKIVESLEISNPLIDYATETVNTQ